MRRMFGREPCSALTGCTKMTWLTNAAMAEMASVVDLCSKRDGSDRRQPYCFTGRNGNMMRPLNSHRARAVFGFFRRRLIAQKTKSSRAVTRVVTTWRQAIQAGYRFIVLPVISTVNSRTPLGAATKAQRTNRKSSKTTSLVAGIWLAWETNGRLV